MMKAWAIPFLLFVATGASASREAPAVEEQNVISVQHDKYRGVTCWVLNDSALSCLPDSMLVRQPDQAAEELQNGDSPAAEQRQDGVNPASTPTPRMHREVFQL
ncbi:hypothetical protein PMM47T1_24164 [Pseudomonas sp. M47T1]|uniref:hypothetical protein n=1 Tax=Pseudomonas sp. M47T1 TaxID=1179778 RepID=UPI0002607E08|nr:hypothetical protein [Pseudomonas sp. M47T1]EIK94045.1 hypothetical protein PMM47T1_24164 [Pseudomonas sp. M47T1]